MRGGLKQFFRVFCLLAMLFAVSFSAVAQVQTLEEAEAAKEQSFDDQLAIWDRTAEQAQLLLDSEDASDLQLENFRKALNINRNMANKYAIDTQSQVADLENQLEALKPAAPLNASGEDADASSQEEAPESDELKARRKEVEAELSEVQGNVLSANQIVKEANSLIQKIDNRLRKNYYNALLTRDSSPLVWSNIQLSAYAIYSIFDSIWSEIKVNFKSLVGSGNISERWPTAIIFIILGMLIFYFSPKLAKLEIHRTKPWPMRAQRLFMPLSGLFVCVFALPVAANLIVSGLKFTGLFGIDGRDFLDSVLTWSYVYFAAVWLRWVILHLRHSPESTKRASFGVAIYSLAVVAAIDWTLEELARLSGVDLAHVTTLHFVLIFIGFAGVWSLTSERNYRRLFGLTELKTYPRLKEAFRRFIRYGTFVAVLLSVIGYFKASFQLFHGIVFTAYYIFAGIYLYRLVMYWAGITLREFGLTKEEGEEPDFSDKLWPILIQIMIWISLVPLILVSWGIPRSTLLEAWTRLKQGVALGDMQISFMNILRLLIVFYVGILIVNALKKSLDRNILARTQMDVGARAAVVSLSGYLGYTIVFFIAVAMAGIDLSALAWIAGALSVGIGFGLQNIVQNFISGIILLVERPIKKGDWINVGGNEGYVKDIAVRSTAIRTFDDSTIIVPNADLISNPVTNWFHDNQTARVVVHVGVSYDADPEHVENVLLDLVHKSTYRRKDSRESVVIRSFGDSAVNYELRFWITSADWLTRSRSEIYFAILKRFKEEGIEIPYPKSDVRIVDIEGRDGTTSPA